MLVLIPSAGPGWSRLVILPPPASRESPSTTRGVGRLPLLALGAGRAGRSGLALAGGWLAGWRVRLDREATRYTCGGEQPSSAAIVVAVRPRCRSSATLAGSTA